MAKKNKRNESYLSIRKKLIAAVAMLLVASFMVASSSYAWFTLSTAPEVTGIQTTVGANGSLEIALRTTATVTIADSTTTDGAQAVTDKNKTWGNLVDLSDGSYHLTDIVLKPARLNVTEGKVSSNMLSVPQYGADGRISKLDATATVSGAFDLTSDAFKVNTYGVRAVGTTTTMTKQALDFSNAHSTIISSLSGAKGKAGNSLYKHGPTLAQVLATKAAGATEYDLSTVNALIADLTAANDYLGAAVKAYYKAWLAATLKDIPEDAYQTIKNAINIEAMDATALASLVTTGYTFTVPEGVSLPTGVSNTLPAAAAGTAIKGTYDMWAANNTAISAATEEINGRNADALKAVSWDEVTSILITSGLVKIDDATLNGFKADQVKTDEAISKIMADIMKPEVGLYIDLGADSGVYSNIASATENYSTTIEFKEGTEVAYAEGKSLDLGGATARMNVKGVDPNYNVLSSTLPGGPNAEMTTAILWATTFTAKDANSDTSATITDAYAYMIDLAFRTNAEGSKLQLQTDATGRIYGEGKGSEETMGGGATMSFESYDLTRFTVDQVKSLMDAIRIVFVDDANNILAIGALDTAAADVAGSKVTAKIRLVNYTLGADGKVEFLKLPVSAEEGAEESIFKTDSALMDLTKNTPTALSVLVYLDGDKVTNKDVAADNISSMTGTLNLQFSSSAELKPMEYANLMNSDGTASGGDEDDDTPAASTNIQLDNTGLTAGANVAQNMTTDQTLVLPAKSADDKDITWNKTSGDNATLADGKLTATAAGEVVLGYSYAGAAEGDPAVTGTVTVNVTVPASGGEG